MSSLGAPKDSKSEGLPEEVGPWNESEEEGELADWKACFTLCEALLLS